MTTPSLAVFPSISVFLSRMAGTVPGLSVKYKADSTLMYLLAGVLFFNPRFLADYTTTLGRTIYVPMGDWTRKDPTSLTYVAAHEAVHAYDYSQSPVRFVLGYLFPQLLALPLFGVLVVLAAGLPRIGAWGLLIPLGFALLALLFARLRLVTASGVNLYLSVGAVVGFAIGAHTLVGPIVALLFLIALCPWPSPGRTAAELRGYTMSLAVEFWQTGGISDATLDRVRNEFTGSSYYWMGWGGPPGMQVVLDRIRTGGILIDPIFQAVLTALAGGPRP